MLEVERRALSSVTGYEYLFRDNDTPLSFGQALELMKIDDEVPTLLTKLLRRVPFEGFRWETPALTRNNHHQQFRFVVIDAPYLNTHPDQHTFARHFEHAGATAICKFDNLGGDAMLIVPAPLRSDDNYAHFGAFLCNAPEQQIGALWQTIGETTLSRLGSRPLWLNTAGDGVAWLHVRLDNRPKYYHYRPYREGGH